MDEIYRPKLDATRTLGQRHNQAHFDYNLSGQATRYQQDGGSYQSLSGYGQTGFNLGARRVRSQYQANYTSDTQGTRFDWDQFYAYRPLPMLAAKLTLGEIYLNSQIFDSVRFTGANLASDERMLPPNCKVMPRRSTALPKATPKSR